MRLVVPGLYGYVSACKWVTELKVTTFAEDMGYWTPRGWSPRDRSRRRPGSTSLAQAPRCRGRVAVAGVAWAQHRGISEVEVQVDDGPWTRARLAADASIDAWRQWVLDWDATPGSHALRVRARDQPDAAVGRYDPRRPTVRKACTVTVRVEAPPRSRTASTGIHVVNVRVDVDDRLGLDLDEQVGVDEAPRPRASRRRAARPRRPRRELDRPPPSARCP